MNCGIRVQTRIYKRVGECDIQADVYLPATDGPYPVIVFIHGGALITGSRRGLLDLHRDGYLSEGYTIVAIDYRLAPETKLPQIIEDLQDAFAWVREQGPELLSADASRIGVVGHSAGGYLTLMAGFCVDPRPQALVSFYGYGDIVGPWYSEPDPFYCQEPLVSREEAWSVIGTRPTSEDFDGGRGIFYLYCRQHGLWPKEVGGHDPALEPGFFSRFCPVRNVDSRYPPTLLLHGNRDTDVPYQQSVMMSAALTAAGTEHELVTIPGGEHGFDRTDDHAAAEAFARVLGFLRLRLRPSE